MGCAGVLLALCWTERRVRSWGEAWSAARVGEAAPKGGRQAPQVRGTQQRLPPTVPVTGSIPACAGNTAHHTGRKAPRSLVFDGAYLLGNGRPPPTCGQRWRSRVGLGFAARPCACRAGCIEGENPCRTRDRGQNPTVIKFGRRHPSRVPASPNVTGGLLRQADGCDGRRRVSAALPKCLTYNAKIAYVAAGGTCSWWWRRGSLAPATPPPTTTYRYGAGGRCPENRWETHIRPRNRTL